LENLINDGKQRFVKKGWKPFDFQVDTWRAFLQEKSGLLNAPTGSGKTYALWVPCLLEYMREHPADYKKPRKNGLRVLWITPLRALARDIQLAMEGMCTDFEIPWEIGIRTGDTSTSDRAKQKRSAPECLVTTPESLHLLLSQKEAVNYFKSLTTIIVDEWHELLGTKRGVQIELAFSRLRATNPGNLKIWGVSATIGNLDQAREVLLGPTLFQGSVAIKANIHKKIEVISVLPDEAEKFPWGGHLGVKMMDKVLPIIENSKTTLLFTNTRSQTEIWYQQILHAAPHLSGAMAMHHGSMDNNVRKWVEEALHAGKLQLVVCTSSLDLGVDFRPVDTVIQVGGPKGVARFMQRAGRSGHQPGATSKIYFVPTHSLELIEGAALRSAIDKDYYESRKPLEKCMDVLVQYLVTLAVGEGFIPDIILNEVKQTYCFSTLSQEEWQWALQFITTGGSSLGEYDEFSKVEIIDGVYRVTDRRKSTMHRLSIGTIVGDPSLRVKYLTGGNIGTVEESFASKLTRGDVFWFAGRNLEFIMIKDMTVLVRKAKKKRGLIPRWGGGRMPLSSQLSILIRQKLEQAALGDFSDIELETIRPIIELQQRWSIVPDAGKLLIEKVESRFGHHLFIYPFEGRFVHEVLGGLVAYRIGKLAPISFSIAMNDYGFELLTDEPIPIEEALELDLFSTTNLLEDIHHSINESEMARRRFRDIASIAGLVFHGFPGKTISNKHLQANSQIIYKVFEDYDKENLLLKQAMDEVITLQMEQSRLLEAVDRINSQQITLMYPPRPSPFAFPIMVESLRERLTTESIEDRVIKLQQQLEKFADSQG
tara:strand:+ start:6569 stop:9037 length:2469 start_codon:yes stop_codon:yes gene_type:complete